MNLLTLKHEYDLQIVSVSNLAMSDLTHWSWVVKNGAVKCYIKDWHRHPGAMWFVTSRGTSNPLAAESYSGVLFKQKPLVDSINTPLRQYSDLQKEIMCRTWIIGYKYNFKDSTDPLSHLVTLWIWTSGSCPPNEIIWPVFLGTLGSQATISAFFIFKIWMEAEVLGCRVQSPHLVVLRDPESLLRNHTWRNSSDIIWCWSFNLDQFRARQALYSRHYLSSPHSHFYMSFL